MILLDTQVVIWLAFADQRLGKVSLARIRDDEDRRVSAMASCEIAMSVDKGRLLLESPLVDWLAQTMRTTGYAEVPVHGAIARDAGSLPGPVHGDPCDRIMIATARWLGCPLLTSDRKILSYAAFGHLKAIDARV